LLFTLQWSLHFIIWEWGIVILQRPVSAYLNVHGENNPRNSFYIFRQQGIYCIFYDILPNLFYFSTKCHLFHNFMFFCSNSIFFINHALKLNTQPAETCDRMLTSTIVLILQNVKLGHTNGLHKQSQ